MGAVCPNKNSLLSFSISDFGPYKMSVGNFRALENISVVGAAPMAPITAMRYENAMLGKN